jgi:hypothetical protein
MFALNRELALLFAAGAIAACLMGVGVLFAINDLLAVRQETAVSAALPAR